MMKFMLRRISRFPLALALFGVVLLVATAVLSAEGHAARQSAPVVDAVLR